MDTLLDWSASFLYVNWTCLKKEQNNSIRNYLHRETYIHRETYPPCETHLELLNGPRPIRPTRLIEKNLGLGS